MLEQTHRLMAAVACVGSLFLLNSATATARPTKGNRTVATFAKAKRIIGQLFAGKRRTFYCGCRFDADGAVSFSSCGYRPRRNPKRARRMEVEHVVPAHAFGQAFPAWRRGHQACVDGGKPYKGRRCALKVSREFRAMEADLFNLQPAVGEVNADRSNYSMAELPGEPRAYGRCDVEIHDRKIEPRPDIRGDIARTYFYMNWAYPGRGIIGRKQKRLFKGWSAADPVDAAERSRVRKIQKVQGNRNPFVR
jgi:deoxyribonuclease I